MLLRPHPRLRTSRVSFPAPERPLTADEAAFARQIFGESLDPGPVRITRDSWLSFGAPKGLRNTVHLKSGWGHFRGEGLALTTAGVQTLVHELVHVWQYQNGGHAYMGESVLAQGVAILRHRDRGRAYRWRRALESGRPWAEWNPEQQASAVERYAVAMLGARTSRSPADAHVLTVLGPAIVELRAGRGAARFSLAGAVVVGGALAALVGLGAAVLVAPGIAGLLAALGGAIGWLAGGGWRPRARSGVRITPSAPG